MHHPDLVAERCQFPGPLVRRRAGLAPLVSELETWMRQEYGTRRARRRDRSYGHSDAALKLQPSPNRYLPSTHPADYQRSTNASAL
jgi:hypothetical protein